MRQKNIDQIKRIIEAIEIQPDRKLFYLHQEFNAYGNYGSAEPVSNDMLQQNLQALIYANFYCRGEGHLNNSNDLEVASDESRRKEFTNALREANASEDRWDYGWQIESPDASGAFHGRKGNHVRQIYPGEFIREYFSRKSPQKHEPVRIWIRRESDEPSDSFYYAFGNTLTEDDHLMLVRFYFNVLPEGAAFLLKSITSSFNYYLIPFQFKCLNDPVLYSRSDTAVLYLNKRYITLAFSILAEMYHRLRPYFQSFVPMFTKKIADGFGFAENPSDPGESFGTNRSRIIANSIVRAFNDQIRRDQWLDSVTKAIEASGYSLDDFHLNPGSHFPYHFHHLNSYEYAF